MWYESIDLKTVAPLFVEVGTYVHIYKCLGGRAAHSAA